MSISPIREAVRQLEALGLAEHVPHHGAKVVALEIEELRELFSIRLSLETMAVRRAAELFDARPAQSDTFFSLIPGAGSDAPNRNRVRIPSVNSSFLRRSGVLNARMNAVSMRRDPFSSVVPAKCSGCVVLARGYDLPDPAGCMPDGKCNDIGHATRVGSWPGPNEAGPDSY